MLYRGRYRRPSVAPRGWPSGQGSSVIFALFFVLSIRGLISYGTSKDIFPIIRGLSRAYYYVGMLVNNVVTALYTLVSNTTIYQHTSTFQKHCRTTFTTEVWLPSFKLRHIY
uniref:Uncharacterized protein n=1 Tax=Cacopsylla melanoneura TaxID=428564 RepID=A0A8D9FC72_9HEMI